ncbi:MAG: CocE/NonD family hydrolase [Solirubrobacterales bacterium]
MRIRLATAVVLAALASLLAPAGAAAALHVRGSVEQVHVTGAKAHQRLALTDRSGRRVTAQRAGALGAAVFRDITPGAGYRVDGAGPVTVLPNRSAPPSTKLYRQRIPSDGYGYLTTRDGTSLAIDVHPPGRAGHGPFPTVVEYSGYGYADPSGGESSIAQIANLLGYAVVDVNMRGTGCSGGAFDYFEPLQGLDGYDVVETVARQPWVAHHRPGMFGISYGGISQLFVARTDPPSLAAITPLSVIDNTATTLYPGGILNTGFALSWAKDRVHDARPASATGGQPWALKRIQGGDRTCKANQALHDQAVDVLGKIRRNRFYVPKVADPVAPITFVHQIKAPVFLACQFTDEQTGGHCPGLASHFTGTRRKWFTFTNGAHVDALDPATFNRLFDFLELYVARRAPRLSPDLRSLAPTIFRTAMGVPDVQLPPDPIQEEPTYADALRAFEAQPPVRILFDNGAGGSTPGAPLPAFEQSFARFPIPGTRPRSWYLGANGALTGRAPGDGGSDRFTWDERARPPTDFSGDTSSGPDGLSTATPPYHWTEHPPGTALAYLSDPLSGDTAIIGAGALQAWIRSSAPEVDLQVTISEVRPDGMETYVQSGWLRSGARTLDPRRSTLLDPIPTFRRADDKPLPRGRYAKLTVPLYYQGHVYRSGSRVRVSISAPGGDQPVWAFGSTDPRGTAPVDVARSPSMPSRVILPEVPGVAVPTGLPPCPGLRGEPCRPFG